VVRLLCLFTVVRLAAAQAPVVGEINFYGLGKTTPERISSALKLRKGDALPPSKGELEDRLEELPEVVLARVEAVCCAGREAALFIGIEERGAPHAAFRSSPSGDAVLPPATMEAYGDYLAAVRRAAAAGNSAEDLTAGHSLMAEPAARAFQQGFADYAAGNLALLRGVLRNGSLGEERAAAAAMIGYAARKQDVVDDLQYALSDPEEAVRANAMRALTAIAVLAARRPEAGIRISPTWFIELLHSIVLGDRTEAVKALLTLTDNNPSALSQIRERALPALIEMARWSTPAYAAPPFLLVGRIAGMTDAQAEASWEKGEREKVIGKLVPGSRKRGG
jgi:HEAT repeat protein